MKIEHTIIALVPAWVIFCFALAVGACGTSLTSLDARATLNQERACSDIAARAAEADAGQIQSLAESCQCGAIGILRRAGQPFDDPPDGACPAATSAVEGGK